MRQYIKLPIEDREAFKYKIKEIVKKEKFKIIEDKGHTFVLKPRLLNWMIGERIKINVSENHVELIGAKQYVDRIEEQINKAHSN